MKANHRLSLITATLFLVATAFLLIDSSPPPAIRALAPEDSSSYFDENSQVEAPPIALIDGPLETKGISVQRLPRPSQQSLWEAISKARHAVTELTEREAAMPHNDGVRYFTSQPEHEFTARFLEDGSVRLNAGYAGACWQGRLKLAGADTVSLQQTGDARVELRHSDHLVEWYENSTQGLEHGFTVHTSQADMASADGLQIAIQVEGMNVEQDPARPGDLILSDLTGEDLLGYQKLKAWDADGQILPSEMRPTESGILLAVNDAGARYPLTIDPVINHISHLQRLEPTHDILPEINDFFGCDVDISGDTAVVGAKYRDTAAGTNAGCAYVFTRNGSAWSFQQELTVPDLAANDEFGFSVTLEGDTVVVGAPMHDNLRTLPDGTPVNSPDSGTVFVFTRSTGIWTPLQKLLPSSRSPDDRFGSSVEISGDSLIVGDPRLSSVGLQSGAAYVFVQSGGIWSEQQQLTASNGGDSDYFGCSVSISGDTAVVGNLSGGQYSPTGGDALVYVRSAGVWTEQAILTSTDLSPGDYFGTEVSVSGDTIAIGAAEHTSAVPYHRGSVFVFTRSGAAWSLQQKLGASDAGNNSLKFGSSLALEGDTLTATAADPWGGSPCYVFTRSAGTWTEQQILTDCGTSTEAGTVALSGSTLIVGSEREQSSQGRAYVYTLEGPTWTQQAELEVASESLFGDAFGITVDMKGSYALIGAWADDSAVGTDTGSVYACTYSYDSGTSSNRWKVKVKLTALDAEPYDRFGSSVAFTDGVWLDFAVGAPGNDNSAGSAYVFVASNGLWAQQQKLLRDDPSAGESFGHSVDMSGETVLVGSPWDGTPEDARGAAYTFLRSDSTWSQQQKLMDPTGTAGDLFGYSVALKGDTAVIGNAHKDYSPGFTDAGSAHVFSRTASTWSQQQILVPTDGQSDYFFGRDLALSDGTLIIGAPGAYNTLGHVSGAAYIFTWDGTNWIEQQKLEASDGSSWDEFGVSVSIDTDVVMVGAWKDDTTAGTDAGSAYLFTKADDGTWAEEEQFFGSSPNAGAAFGNAVANTQSQAAVGSYLANGAEDNHSGIIDIFALERIMLTTNELMEGQPSGTRIAGVSVHSPRTGWTVTIPQGFEENHMFYVHTAMWFGRSLYPYYSFDHEEQVTRTIRLRATRGSETFEETFLIHILDDRTEDADGDGLTEAEEEDTYGTSDLNPDDDNDGIPGGTEVAAGLDPATDNSALISAIQSKPTEFGVDMDALSLGHPVIRRDPATGMITLTLDVDKSTDLSTFNDMPVSADEVSVNANGDVEVKFTSPEDAAFFRVEGK